MRVLSIFLFAIVFLSAGPALAKQEQVDYTEEGLFYGFYLGKDLQGYVKTKACKTCKEKVIKITADARAFLDGKQVPLSRFVMSKHVPSSVHFYVKTKKLSKIVWFTKK